MQVKPRFQLRHIKAYVACGTPFMNVNRSLEFIYIRVRKEKLCWCQNRRICRLLVKLVWRMSNISTNDPVKTFCFVFFSKSHFKMSSSNYDILDKRALIDFFLLLYSGGYFLAIRDNTERKRDRNRNIPHAHSSISKNTSDFCNFCFLKCR